MLLSVSVMKLFCHKPPPLSSPTCQFYDLHILFVLAPARVAILWLDLLVFSIFLYAHAIADF